MKRTTHTLMVLPWYKPAVGGVVHGVSQLVKLLPARGIKLTLLLQEPHETPTKLDEDQGTEIFGFNHRAPSVEDHRIKGTAGFAFFLYRTVARLRRFMKEREIDVVNVHYPSAMYFYFGLLKRNHGYPLVISLHGSDIQYGFDTVRANRMAYAHLLRSADVVTGVSNSLLMQARTRVPDMKAKAVVIPGGAPSVFFEAATLPVEPTDRPIILCVARLHPVKGHDTLLRAFRLLKERDTSRCCLVLAGDGEKREEIRALISELGLDNDVVMAGSVPQQELVRMNRNALFTVLASRSEGLPLTVIEAFAAGRTVVATDVGGVSEIVRDGKTGLLVPADNPSALAEKMYRMLTQDQERHEMEIQARALVSQGYTWDANADAYAEIFQNLAVKRL